MKAILVVLIFSKLSIAKHIVQEIYCDSSLLNTDHATYTVEPSTAVYGSIARYTCADGYIPARGDSERTCTEGGGWNGSALICNPEHVCNNPPVVDHASHNGSNEYYLAGELLVYTCDHGYSRGNSFPWLRCQQAGDTTAWGNFDMTCSRFAKDFPGHCDISHLKYDLVAADESQPFTPNGGYLIIRCKDNRIVNNGHNLKCVNGKWIGNGNCNGIAKGPPGHCDISDLKHDLVAVDESNPFTPNGGYLKLRCKGNQIINHGVHLTCVNGKWIGNTHCIDFKDQL